MTSQFADIPITAVRDFWNARPCNIRHSNAEVGSKQYFDEVEQRKYFVEPHIPEFADFGAWRGKKVLEIGCGIGTDTINFARAGASVTAVDLSSESLNIARQRAEIFGLSDRIEFVEANAETLSEYVKPQVFDLVYSFGVIHHSPHPQEVIRQIRENYVSAGTRLKLMVYNRRSWKVLEMRLAEGLPPRPLDVIIARSSEAQSGCPITYSYTGENISDLIGDGFKINEVFADHIFPYRVDKYVNYEYEKVWYFKMMPKALFRHLERRLGWHLCITATAT